MLCAFPSRHFKDVVQFVLPVTDSCFLSEPFIRTHTNSFTFESFVYTFTKQDTVDTTSFLDHHQKKWLLNGIIHSIALIPRHQPGGSVQNYESSQIHRRCLKPKIDKALASIWAESTTCFQEFRDSEHIIPDQIFSTYYVLQVLRSAVESQLTSRTTYVDWKGSTNFLERKWPFPQIATSKPNQLDYTNSTC